MAIIASRNRVADYCDAEVTSEDAVKGDKAIKQIGRQRSDVVVRCHQNHQCHVESCTQEELREDSPILPWLVEHARRILSRCQKGRDDCTSFERLHGKKPTRVFVPFGENVLARPISSEPLNRMNPRYEFGVLLGVRNNSAECFVGTAEGVFIQSA